MIKSVHAQLLKLVFDTGPLYKMWPDDKVMKTGSVILCFSGANLSKYQTHLTCSVPRTFGSPSVYGKQGPRVVTDFV